MNQDQIAHLIRMALAAGGPLGGMMIANHYATADQQNAIADGIAALVGVVPPIVAGVWGLFAHTTSAKIAAVEALPIQKIVVAPDAPQELQDIVRDASRPKVIAPDRPLEQVKMAQRS